MTGQTLYTPDSSSVAVASTTATDCSLITVSPEVQTGAEQFFAAWVAAWNRPDAHALALLHTEDAVTINRYGTVLWGRSSAEEALSFLRGPHGPFGDAVFPPMRIVGLREIAPGVAIAQATWSAPALGADGKTVPGEFNEMVLSYTLVKDRGDWKTAQIDGHNVEHMELPFSNPEQKN